MSRKLASVQIVKAIKPIEGADRIEVVQILNWDCVVSKGQYQVGDKVIYFEIDSLLPDIPMLEFLKKSSWSQKLNKYKISTHKFRNQISQGLVIPVSDLPAFMEQVIQLTDPDAVVAAVGLEYLTEGLDLTEVLGIEKYEPLVYNGPLGDVISHEWYVPKTDECLAGKTLIDTEQGKIPISKIVNEKMNIRVKSYNENSGKIEYKPVINYFKKLCTENVVILKSVTTLGRRTNDIICTSNHPFYTNNGLKSAEELSVKDKIYREGIKLTDFDKEVLLGALLGDGSIVKDSRSDVGNYHIGFTQSESQFDYLKYKTELLSHLFSDEISYYKTKSGYNPDNIIYNCSTKSLTDLTTFCKKYCEKNDKKYITENWANNLTPLSLAIWYMDDGTITIHDTESIYIRIATNAYSLSEQNHLIDALYYIYEIHANIQLDSRTNTYFLSMKSNEAHKFCKIIAKYVPDCMAYKLPKKYQHKHEKITKKELPNLVECSILSVVPSSIEYVYNIQVADNENYFANGVLTHNCRIQTCAENVLPAYMHADSGDWYTSIKLDGTSCTFGLYDDGFYIAGRNQFYKGPNMYTETVNKYDPDIEARFKSYLEHYGTYIIFQGELCGPGIQGNKLGLKEKELFVFNAFASATGKMDSYEKLDLIGMLGACAHFGLKHVPLVDHELKFDFKRDRGYIDDTVENLLNYADNFRYRDYFKDASPNQMAEGLVFRMNDMINSFKVISNKFLLKGGE